METLTALRSDKADGVTGGPVMGSVIDQHPGKVFAVGHKGIDAGTRLTIVVYYDLPGLALCHVISPCLDLQKNMHLNSNVDNYYVFLIGTPLL